MAITGCLVCAAIIMGDVAKARDTRVRLELAEATMVARDFIDLVTSLRPNDAVGLLQPEYARAILADKYSASFLVKFNWWGSAQITKQESVSNGNEVIFTGRLKGTEGTDQTDADFTIRVAREWQGGKWSVRMVKIKEQNEPKKGK